MFGSDKFSIINEGEMRFLIEFFNKKFFNCHYLLEDWNKLIKKLYFWRKLKTISAFRNNLC